MFKKVLIANRGEIALRLVRAVQDRGLTSVAVFAQDDADAAHVRAADQALPLGLVGPAAYLDIPALIDLACRSGCDAIHPGYGFLSERADFAIACAQAGLTFIGPTPTQLGLLGDKAQARALARGLGVPVLPGSDSAVSLAQAQDFLATCPGGLMIKAIGGGGGRGMRAVTSADELAPAYARCTQEARSAFGVEGVYVEQLMRRARHIEIQVIGDGRTVLSLGDRECSLQRRFQKLIEIAPSPSLPPALRDQITRAALTMAQAVTYQSLGTFEFLVDLESSTLPFVFIEANARLQVEHTVTEAVTGLDLVQLQLGVAAGQTLSDLGLVTQGDGQDKLTYPQRGFAVQWRINAETLNVQGQAIPSVGTLTRFDLPGGPGIRVDTHGFAGATPSPHYDTLLAKLVVHGSQFADVARRGRRALRECCIEGLATNLGLLQALTHHPAFDTQQVHTRFVEESLADLLALAQQWPSDGMANASSNATKNIANYDQATGTTALNDLNNVNLNEKGLLAARTTLPARVVQIDVAVGDLLVSGQQVGVLEAMKMEHLLLAEVSGRVVQLDVGLGDYLVPGQALLWVEPADTASELAGAPDTKVASDPEQLRPDLQKVLARQALTQDAQRPQAVARRHAQGGRTARENLADLCDLVQDPGNFLEYGALAIAAQTRRRTVDDLIANTPADGMVTGIGSVNANLFGQQASRCVVMAYDFTVLAGTQGMRNHQKTDRLLGQALALKLPVVLFAEGGGGRPGDVDSAVVAGLNVATFASFAKLNGLVPVVGIVAGRCFAGNAALLGCCDVIIATRNSNIGMGGPAMVEGGGLGVFKPEHIGPSPLQHANGVIDVLVDDEVDAVAAAKHYLSFFQGCTPQWAAPDPLTLRQLVPDNRRRVYDTAGAMSGVVDEGSLLPLRTGFGSGIHTALGRIEGRPVGLIANNPLHLGGAIDADAADKAARFMQLCNAHGLPLVSFVDTPGFMVGPDIEALAQVRHVSRMFIAGAHLRVPLLAVVLRKGYGLGAMAMTAGGFAASAFTIAWPTGEFGGMGLEGAVKLGFRKELDAAPAGAQREALYQSLVDQHYENGSAINMATHLEIDAVIDPAHTRAWLVRGLQSAKIAVSTEPRMIDAW